MTKFARMARPAPDADTSAPIEVAALPAPALAKVPTKVSQILDLLRREQGALLSDITITTGWQPHTARAVLTGLKKKGHAIESRRADKLTTYFLA